MKGFKKDGKFRPIKPYNKVRKSRDNSTKEQGVRQKRSQDLVYAESSNRGQLIKVKGHGNDWMLFVDGNLVGRAKTKKEIFKMYDKVNTHPESGSPHFYDPRVPQNLDKTSNFKVVKTQRSKREILEDDAEDIDTLQHAVDSLHDSEIADEIDIMLDRLKDKAGLSDDDESSNEINIKTSRVVDIIREQGGVSASEIAEIITGKSDDQQRKEGIRLNLHLAELEDEGKIAVDKKTLKWYVKS